VNFPHTLLEFQAYSPTAGVLSTDNMPAWDIAATLTPSQIVNFNFYIQVERDAAISNF
jgi:hypothetical protein